MLNGNYARGSEEPWEQEGEKNTKIDNSLPIAVFNLIKRLSRLESQVPGQYPYTAAAIASSPCVCLFLLLYDTAPRGKETRKLPLIQAEKVCL